MTLTPKLSFNGILIRRELMTTAFRLRRTIAIVSVAILVSACAAAALIAPKWQTDMSLMLLLGPDYGFRSGAGGGGGVNAMYDHDEMLDTEIGILKSRDLHRDVLRKIGVATLYPKYVETPNILSQALSAIRTLPAEALAALTGKSFAVKETDPVELALDEFDQSLMTEGDKRGALIKVSFQHKDPELSQLAMETLQQVYLQRRSTLFENDQADMVGLQAEQQRMRLDELDRRLMAYKAENGIANYATRLDILLHQQGDAEQDLKLAESLVSQSQSRLASLRAQMSSTPAENVQSRESDIDERVSAERISLDALRAKRESLVSRYREDSDPVKAIDAQIAGREAELATARGDTTPGSYRVAQNPVYVTLGTQMTQVQSDLSAALSRQQRDQSQLTELASRIADLNTKARDLDDMERQRAVAEDNYKHLTQLRDDRRVFEQVQASKMGDVRVIDRPVAPLQPKPIRMLILLGGLVASVVTAIMIVLIGNYARRDFLFAASFERDCGIPVLAEIPDFSAFDRAVPVGSAHE